jgi:hypothetical protein
MISRSSSILASAVVLLLARAAIAQSSSAIAEGLFRDGTKLLVKKKYAEACPKLEESARLEASSGVELALGICYEGLGKTASAWAAYETAVTLARWDNRADREHKATQQANALEPKLAHATLEIPPDVAQLAGLQVKEDGIALGAAAWRNAPIDPGEHSLEVTATGKKPWSTTFTIEGPATSKTVTIPELENVPIVTNDEPRVVGEDRAVSPFRIGAYAGLGVGAASLIVASILGGVALGDAGDAHKSCPSPTCTNAQAVSENNTAGTLADWSTVLFVVSGVCLAAGAVLFFIRPGRTARPAAIYPLIGPGVLGLRGVF